VTKLPGAVKALTMTTTRSGEFPSLIGS
jgi:hypothetical protein